MALRTHIRSLRLKNFRSFKDEVTFQLKPITIITGPNSSGKSSILRALRLLRDNLLDNVDTIDFTGNKNSGLSFEPPNQIGLFEYAENRTTLSETSIAPITFGVEVCEEQGGHYAKKMVSIQEMEESIQREERRKERQIWKNTNTHEFIIECIKAENPEIAEISKYTISKFIESGKDISREPQKICEFLRGEKPFIRVSEGVKKNIDNYLIQTQHKENSLNEDIKNIVLEIIESISGLLNGWYGYKESRHNHRKRTTDIKYSYEIESQLDKWLQYKFYDEEESQTYFSDEDRMDYALFEKWIHGTNPVLWSYISRLDEKSGWWIIRTIEKLLYQYDEEIAGKHEILCLALRSLCYIPAVRANMQRLYTIESQGTSFNKMLSETVNADVDFEFINRWLKEFKLGDELKVSSLGGAVRQVQVVKDGKEYELADLGYGTTQVLPMMIGIALGKIYKKTMFLIEEPEANLHPNLQSRLADFFVDAYNEDNNFVIETHSEYLIRKLQYLVATDKISPEDIIIYYLGDNPDAKDYVKEIKIAQNGQLTENFGTGFFDEAANLMIDLYKKRSSN